MSERRARPFGIVEQRELQRLREYGATHAHIAALLVLRIRQDPNGEVRDGRASLARWTGMSEATMKRALQWLVAHHIVVELDRERTAEAGQGAAWRHPRRVAPFELWPRTKDSPPEALPLWKAERRSPTYEELAEFKAAGGRL
jgi:hypothetical protein